MLGNKTEPQNSSEFFEALGLQTLNDNPFDSSKDNEVVNNGNADESLEFFHSLGLQTLQEASKRNDRAGANDSKEYANEAGINI